MKSTSSSTLRGIITQLEPKNDWNKRREALRALQALATDAAESGGGTAINFKEVMLRDVLSQQVVDLRSAVAVEASQTVGVLAANVPDSQWIRMSDWFLDALFHNMCQSSVVANVTLDVLLKMFSRHETCSNTALTAVMGHAKAKHPAVRCAAYSVLRTVIEHHFVPERSFEAIDAAVRAGTQDANPDARATCREAVAVLDGVGDAVVASQATPSAAPRSRAGPRELLDVAAVGVDAPPTVRNPNNNNNNNNSQAPTPSSTSSSSSLHHNKKCFSTTKPTEPIATTNNNSNNNSAPTPTLSSAKKSGDPLAKIRSVLSSDRVAGLEMLRFRDTPPLSTREITAVVKCTQDTTPHVAALALHMCRENLAAFIEGSETNLVSIMGTALGYTATPMTAASDAANRDVRDAAVVLLEHISLVPLRLLSAAWAKVFTSHLFINLREACLGHVVATLTHTTVCKTVAEVDISVVVGNIITPMAPMLRETHTQKEAVRCVHIIESHWDGATEAFLNSITSMAERAEWHRVLQKVGLAGRAMTAPAPSPAPAAASVVPTARHRHAEPLPVATSASPAPRLRTGTGQRNRQHVGQQQQHATSISPPNVSRRIMASEAREEDEPNPPAVVLTAAHTLTRDRLQAFTRSPLELRSEANVEAFLSDVCDVFLDPVNGDDTLALPALGALKSGCLHTLSLDLIFKMLRALHGAHTRFFSKYTHAIDDGVGSLYATQDLADSLTATVMVLESHTSWGYCCLRVWIKQAHQARRPDALRRALEQVWVSHLARDITHPNVDVRKPVVLCAVAFYLAVPDDTIPYLATTTAPKHVSLIQTYVNLELSNNNNGSGTVGLVPHVDLKAQVEKYNNSNSNCNEEATDPFA
eukprot:PhM_4_TR1353/c0_g1_i1/m.44071